jgi:HEPN domain-containing protein
VDVERQVEYWRSGSAEDIAAALSLADQHPRHALLVAHLALEKILKALVTRATAAVPPHVHDLLRLAEQADLPLDGQRRESLAGFQKYAIEGHDPAIQSAPLSRQEAADGLRTAQEMLAWLQSQLS